MMGKGGGRERMEVWFRRAMAADPDNYAACSKKLVLPRTQVARQHRGADGVRATVFPDRLVDRARFIQLAGRLGKWDDIDRQAQILGDVPPPGVFPDPGVYTQVRALATRELGKGGPPKPGETRGVPVGGFYYRNELDSTGLGTYGRGRPRWPADSDPSAEARRLRHPLPPEYRGEGEEALATWRGV
jgi:hypothetical protein